MQIPQKYPQFLDEEALVVVAGKEHGLIYRIQDGFMETLDELEHHPPQLSDDEGFFFSGGKGGAFTGGAPKELDETEYIKQFDRLVAAELDTLIKTHKPQLLYIFEPDYLKGRIAGELQKHPGLIIHTVRHGNYTKEHPEQLLGYIQEYIDEHLPHTDRPQDFAADLKKYS